MAQDFKLHLRLADGHLQLVPQGKLTALGIKQILRAAEVGLLVFPVVIVDLQEARESQENIVTLLEEGLRQVIAKRKQDLLKAQGNGPCNNFSSPSNLPGQWPIPGLPLRFHKGSTIQSETGCNPEGATAPSHLK